MRQPSILYLPLILGASALVFSQGCGAGGPGAGPSIGDSPFGSPPPSDTRGGNPSNANNPFKGSTPSGNDGYQSSPESGGYNAPSTSGGGFESAPGAGNCVGAIKQVYDRCGITEQLSKSPETIAEVDRLLKQICEAISTSPGCSSCVLSQLPNLSCNVINEDGDGNEDNRICEAACSDVKFKFESGGGSGGSGGGGQGGSGGSGGSGGGQGGSGGGANLCSRCGVFDTCQLGITSAQCAQLCNESPPGCEPCILAAGENCESIAQCLQGPCGAE
ncbi:MAG: hypothetical protein RMJ98_10210 [Myxococcales bacterium]|nr:hypothetical protein [Polyangiaceae bacterium]MDW8249661.1 hypothetical protein [Myxococcales bacterium]